MVPVGLILLGMTCASIANTQVEYRTIVVNKWLRGELSVEEAKVNLQILKQYKLKKD